MPTRNRAAGAVRVPVTCPQCRFTREVRADSFHRIKTGVRKPHCRSCVVPAADPAPPKRPPRVPLADRPDCRHCGKVKANRPRGLCWRCFYTPGVKDMHPSTSKYAKRGVGRFAGGAPLAEPTDALPGTPEKVAVMEARAAAGLAIFHPLDGIRSRG